MISRAPGRALGYLERAAVRVKSLLPVSIERLVDSCAYLIWPSRKLERRATSAGAFRDIYSSNYWESGGESRSGPGSTMNATVKLRETLPQLWSRYGIRTVLDAPCGDWAWMKEVDKSGITYIGYDIVEEVIEANTRKYENQHVSFRVADITKDDLPCVDMIFCKDCLQHLSYENIQRALRNFKMSGSTYLLTTSYRLTLMNHDIADGDYRALNLTRKPIRLPKQKILDKIQELPGTGVEPDKCLYLWKLSDVTL